MLVWCRVLAPMQSARVAVQITPTYKLDTLTFLKCACLTRHHDTRMLTGGKCATSAIVNLLLLAPQRGVTFQTWLMMFRMTSLHMRPTHASLEDFHKTLRCAFRAVRWRICVAMRRRLCCWNRDSRKTLPCCRCVHDPA